MFDDFMHNDFSEMHFNQAQQDAMLHAQNQAMNQAAQQASGGRMQADQQNQPSLGTIPPMKLQIIAMGFGLAQVVLARILNQPRQEK